MRTLTLAFNPAMVKAQDLENFADRMMRDHACIVYYIAHLDHNAEPIYCIQFTDTKERLQYNVSLPQKD